MTHEAYLMNWQNFFISPTGPGDWGELYEHNVAEIIYFSPKEDANANNRNQRIFIGRVVWIVYKQELAIR